MPFVIVKHRGKEVARVDLKADRTSVGRRASCAVAVPDVLFRDVHAFIERQGSSYFFMPTDGSDGSQLAHKHPLTVGDSTLEVIFDGPSRLSSPFTDVTDQDERGTLPTHLVVKANGTERTLKLPTHLAVGGETDNDLVVQVKGMSRRHFKLGLTRLGLWVTDLDSTNGTFVASLSNPGDHVRVVQTQVKLGQSIFAGGAEFIPTLGAPVLGDFGGMIGQSDAMQALYPLIARAAQTDENVLILGETGTGKEHVAKELHQRSGRVGRPLVIVNVSAIPKDLMESELFGHEKGSFTSAVSRREGVFKQAHGGVLFLDEIGDMPLAMQPKLLRVLQTGVFRRVGGEEDIKVDVRVIAATHKDLHLEVLDGNFREDLMYRLNVITLRVPPLRERGTDVRRLGGHYLLAREQKTGVRLPVTEAAWQELENYPWPGNVRELHGVLASAVALRDPKSIAALDVKDLKLNKRAPARRPGPKHVREVAGAPGWIRYAGRTNEELIDARVLLELDAGPTQKEAAERMGIKAKTVRERLKRMAKEQ